MIPNLSTYRQSKVVFLAWIFLVVFWARRAAVIFENEGLDFALYYSIGELINAGDPGGLYISAEQAPYYAYSPMVAPVFAVLSWLPYAWSKWLFFLLKPVALFSWPFLLTATFRRVDVKRAFLSGVIASTIALPTIFEETIVGNINIYLLTLLFASLALTSCGRTFWAAIIVTFVAAFKPQYTLFIVPPLLIGPRGAVVGGFIGAAILGFYSVAIFGFLEFFNLLKAWLNIIAVPIAGPGDVNNMSTNGVLIRLLSPTVLSESGGFQDMNIFDIDPSASSMVGRIASFLAGGVAVLCGLSSIHRSESQRLEGVPVVATAVALFTLVVTPVIWQTHYMLLVYPVFSFLMFAYPRWPMVAWGVGITAAVSLYAAGRFLYFSNEGRVMVRAYGLPLWALLTLTLGCTIVFWDCRRRNAASTEVK